MNKFLVASIYGFVCWMHDQYDWTWSSNIQFAKGFESIEKAKEFIEKENIDHLNEWYILEFKEKIS